MLTTARVSVCVVVLSFAGMGQASQAPAMPTTLERAKIAEAQGQPREAFDAYLDAWADPQHRAEAARRARALERAARVAREDDLSAVESLRAKLGTDARTYRSRSFLVLSDAADQWTRSRITLLERAREQFYREMDRLDLPLHPHRHRLVCVIFARHEDYLAFAREHDQFEAGWAAGYYSMAHNAIVIHDDRTSPALARVMREMQEQQARIDDLTGRAQLARAKGQSDQARILTDAAAGLEAHLRRERQRIEDETLGFGVAKVLHEAIHLLAFNTGLQARGAAYPLWVSEGLAASFEASSTTSQFGFAFPYVPRELELEHLALENRLPRLADIVTLDRNEGFDAQSARPLYALAYGLFKELHRTHRDELAAYLAELADMPTGPRHPRDHVVQFERHFGPIEDLERRLTRRWVMAAREREAKRAETLRTAGQ